MSSRVPGWVWFAGLAGAAWALYRVSDAFKRGIATVTAPVTNAIGDAYFALTSDTPVQSTLTGAVLFPGGARVPMTQLSVKPYNGPAGFEARVTYQGKAYRLSPHDANGNYPAVPV